MTVATVDVKPMLMSLGHRPGREAVEQAKQAMTRIDDLLNEDLKNVVLASPPSGMDVREWRESQELALREGAEKEKIPYKSVIVLDDLHQSYEEEKPDEEKQPAEGETFEAQFAILSTGEKSHAGADHLLRAAISIKMDKLDLSNRLLSRIHQSFGQIVTLVSLNLSDNELKSLPSSIAGLVNLELLNVKSNQLESLPDSIGSLTKLKYIDVSSNALNKLPEDIGLCSSLLEVNASFNHLEFVPANFGFMLVFLEKLDLHLNRLHTIPASVCQIRSLKYLDLHMNKMRALPASIGNLTQLEYLDVSSNFSDLVYLPESVGDLLSLTYFDLSFNQIKELPDSLGKLEKLSTLKLEGNPLVVPLMNVVEHSHDAVMAYLHQRYVNSTLSDLRVSASSKTLLYKGKNDYNPWVPACAGNSPLAAWMGGICGNMGNVLGSGTSDFLGFQKYQNDEMPGQRL